MDVLKDQNLKEEFEACGRVWLRGAISDADLSLFETASSDNSAAGQRLGPSSALSTALSPKSSLLHAVRRLRPGAHPVRVVAFDKSATANWGVPWHQDRVIAVADKADVTGFGNWTKKAGTWHCEPPKSVLENMLFVRVHIDDSQPSNGAMEIALGSHAEGIIASDKAAEVAAQYPTEKCDAKRGDVLVLKMLTLHASKPAQVHSRRRVLRVDFSSESLPRPLNWAHPQ